MKTTININLANKPFIIDQDAYDYLSSYLSIVENHFAQKLNCEEVVSDVELAMSVKLQQRLDGNDIVTLDDVDAVIEDIGRIEELDPSYRSHNYRKTSYTDSTTYSSQKSNHHNYKTGKRLYRDEQEQVLGGVCAGIAAYIGTDPIFVRIFFVLANVLGGASFALYILLWIIIPRAKTQQQKEMMYGRKIEMDDVVNAFEEGVEELSIDLDELKKAFKEKKKQRMYR